jgi:hypothetical protein
MHRGGSSITGRLLQIVASAAGYRLVDEARRYYEAGYSVDDIPQQFFTELAPTDTFYGPFRSYPLTMRLANLSAITKILIVRDPRDCLVSSYYAQRGPHDRTDLRRAKIRLPTQLDGDESIDDFCIRAAEPVRRHFDAMRVLCLHYPETMVFRYEDIFADPCGWLAGVVARLSLSVPSEAFDQARVEAVFDADGEDAQRHHRQGRPRDHQQKLLRQTALYLADFFAPQLTFFSYCGAFAQPADWRGAARPSATAVTDEGDMAALKRLVNDLQRENGFRIWEIAALRQSIASQRAPDEQAA